MEKGNDRSSLLKYLADRKQSRRENAKYQANCKNRLLKNF